MRSPHPRPKAPARSLRQVFRAGVLAAGLYAAALGPAGALAQDPTGPTGPAGPAQEETTATPATTADPTSTPTPEPSVTPTPEPSTPPAEPTPTPEPATPPAEPTPTPTASPEPTPTAQPSPTPTPQELATATPEAVDGGVTVDVETTDGAGEPEGTHTLVPCDTAAVKKATKGLTGEVSDTATAGLGSSMTGAKKTVERISTSAGGSDCAEKRKDADHDRPSKVKAPDLYAADGTPTLDNPTLSLAMPGPAPIGVPNFFIEKFRIPPFLLPIYQAAGMEYGVRWEVLAAINEIETDYGRNLNVSSAGALGWMQFMPATWKQYGVDANRDGMRDPYNPVDAIFAAARYLRAAGADTDIRRAIFAYNHADWYVDSVIMRARLIGGLPSNFVGSLTGLTQARFPVDAKARYAGDLDAGKIRHRKIARGANAALPVESQADRRGIKIFSKRGAPVIAVNDGKIVRIGESERLGKFIQLQDVYGNVFTYAHLAKTAETYPAPRPRRVSKAAIARELALPKADAKPTAAASATTKAAAKRAAAKTRKSARTTGAAKRAAARTAPAAAKQRLAANADSVVPAVAKDRLFAHPSRPAARAAGGDLQLAEASYKPAAGAALKLNRRDYVAKPMHKGARVIAGTILGRIGKTSKRTAPHMLFEIRPAGRGAPRIDPKPILDGWKLLESTEIYRAAGKNPFFGPDAETPSIGQILLMGKQALQEHILANPRIEIYGCGRRDVRIGAIDRRVLATLEFLAASGLKPTVTSLQCGHGFYTASGNVSEHSSGNAVDIAAVNGITITPATQGEGSVTELTIQRLLTLQGTMKPHQIISLMTFDGADNTYAMGDHGDHIHVGFQPLYGTNSKAAKQVNAVLKPKQWIKLIDRLGEIDNPTVRQSPSKYALETAKADAAAGKGTD